MRRRRRAARRRHRGGDRPPARALRAARPCRSSTTTASSGSWSVVDGVGDGDEVFERLVKDDRRARLEPHGRRDHAQDRRPDRADAARRAASSPRCTRCASGPPSRARRTADLDAAAREVLERRGARSNFLGYHGFPAVVCISPNEVIVHGIPERRGVLDDGDIVSIDCGAIIEGWHADAAITVPVGDVDDESQRLIDVTRRVARGRDRRRWSRRQPARRRRRRGRGRRRARRASPWCGSTSATASAPPCTKTRRSRTTGRAGRGMQLKDGHGARDRADGQRGHAPTTRLLDDGWTVVTADGAPLRPLRAHHRHHRRRPRGPDRCPGDAIGARMLRLAAGGSRDSRYCSSVGSECPSARLVLPSRGSSVTCSSRW